MIKACNGDVACRYAMIMRFGEENISPCLHSSREMRLQHGSQVLFRHDAAQIERGKNKRSNVSGQRKIAQYALVLSVDATNSVEPWVRSRGIKSNRVQAKKKCEASEKALGSAKPATFHSLISRNILSWDGCGRWMKWKQGVERNDGVG